MIKNILIAGALATTPVMINNVLVPQTHKDQTTIQTNGVIYQQVSYDQNNDVLQGRYYAVKEFTSNMTVGQATIKGKGYQYTYIDNTDGGYGTQTIDYYFKIEYSADATLTYNDINLYLKGNINPNGYDAYFEDYYVSWIFSTSSTDIDNFINQQSYTYSQLNSLRTAPWVNRLSHTYIDIVDEYCNITIPSTVATKPTYIKFSIDYEVDETELIPSKLIDTTKNVYTTITSAYTYSYDVNYTYEVVDVPGLLFQILGMPFAWFSTAFNLTIFPGTPYAINISRLIFTLLGALILVLILKKILK